jgi:peptidoglycan/LPS O-acetylase OafA/YrhL
MAVGVLLVSATPLAGPTMLAVASPEQSLTKSVTYAIVGGLLILPGVFAVEGSSYLRIMSLKPLRHLGLISYGIFCIHLPLLHLVMAVTGYTLFDGHLLQIWTLTLVSAIVVSEVIYRVLERPAMRLKRPRVLGGTSSASRTAPARETSTR